MRDCAISTVLVALEAERDRQLRLAVGPGSGDSIITLLYEEPLLDGWEDAARELSGKLGCSITARSRKVVTTALRNLVLPRRTTPLVFYTAPSLLQSHLCLRGFPPLHRRARRRTRASGARAARQGSSTTVSTASRRGESTDELPFVGAPRRYGVLFQVGRNYVVERYSLADGRELQYKQPEGSFSNPNASVCVGTLNWLCDVSSGIDGAKARTPFR